MADQLPSLFSGADPAMLQQAIRTQEQTNLLAQANLTPEQALMFRSASAGQELGKALGGVVGGIFGMDVTDPRLKKAQIAQSVINDVGTLGLDPTDPKYFMAVSKLATQRGLPELADIASQNLQNMLKTSASIQETQAKALKERFVNVPDVGLVDITTQQVVTPIGQKPVPGNVAEKIAGATQSLSILNDTADELTSWIKKVNPKNPEVTFGPGSTIANIASSLVGSPTENALKQDSLKRFLTGEINNLLIAAKGTQTEGDANRAARQIADALASNSNAGMEAALKDLERVKKSTIKSLEAYKTTIRSESVRQVPGVAPTAPAAPTTAPAPAAQADYKADYAKYKAKYGNAALPYEVYVARRQGQ